MKGTTEMSRKKKPKSKRFSDEILQDYCFTLAEEYFKINILIYRT